MRNPNFVLIGTVFGFLGYINNMRYIGPELL